MKVIMVMFDTLNRHMLPCYGGKEVHAPHFERLARETVTFDTSYVCSMPCMPARRDWHTGRPNFLHRSWGPLEPFDDSVPRLLKDTKIHSHLVTDNHHYFAEGGANYHTKYATWDFIRGQETDPWSTALQEPSPPENSIGQHRVQDLKNRQKILEANAFPQTKTFEAGLIFIEENKAEDNWFLHIETFDPHEPFVSDQASKDHYPAHYSRYKGPAFDWPPYTTHTEGDEETEHCRQEYKSLLTMCDQSLGRVLDAMDKHGLWEDTMLIVWTDHGFLLGEHECWAKMWMPFYEEVAHTPFFIWDPRSQKKGERRQSLVQPSVDLGPTVLDFFELEIPPDMTGHALGETIASDAPVREAAIFGNFGGQVNVTDGRYVYMRAAENENNSPLEEYSLMPSHMKQSFDTNRFGDDLQLASPFPFTKGCHTLQFTCPGQKTKRHADVYKTQLFDLQKDPRQQAPLKDSEVEARMQSLLKQEMQAVHAPASQFERLGL